MSISDPTRLDQDVALDYELSIPRYAEVGGDTLRFLPFGSRRGYVETYAGLVERRGDLVLDGPSVSRFTFRYRLPSGWSVDALPPDVTTDSGFGKLRLTYVVEQGILVCRGELVFTRDRIWRTSTLPSAPSSPRWTRPSRARCWFAGRRSPSATARRASARVAGHATPSATSP